MAIPRLLREPLLHFLVLGGLIVAALQFQQRAQHRYQIRIDDGVKQQLVAGYQQQFGAAPDAATLRRLIDQRVREEIMVREAQALGLDRDDEIIRRRLRQKYEFLQQDLAVAPEPDQQQLQAYYQQYRATYAAPARVSFTHIYFAPEPGDAEIQRRAQRVLHTLAGRRGPARAPELGDRFPDRYDYASLDASELERLFGPSPLAAALLTAPERQWSGPYRSGFGWHLVYVTGREAPRQPSLAEVRERVRSDWLNAARERANEAEFARVAAHYRVEHAR